ncbi:hypothetical protein [Bifidobacterium callitrichos]|uniref:hypothetical protein n=1 Tax=Bifidobacterium callitrichos TaxID=762209 RepID=UPI002159251A|nr:hypothetical protein [Bifidobacterium callitrichos]
MTNILRLNKLESQTIVSTATDFDLVRQLTDEVLALDDLFTAKDQATTQRHESGQAGQTPLSDETGRQTRQTTHRRGSGGAGGTPVPQLDQLGEQRPSRARHSLLRGPRRLNGHTETGDGHRHDVRAVHLESQHTTNAAQSSGLFGIGLGALSILIGLWMLLRKRWPEQAIVNPAGTTMSSKASDE